MDLGLTGRTAIVCGASSGMGLAIAEALAAEGANVAMFARRRDAARARGRRGSARSPSRATSRSPSTSSASSTTTVDAFGGIDVLVLNGGGPPPGPAVGLTPEAVEAAVELLLTPHVRLVGLCLPHLRESGRGRIVAIESTSVKEPIAEPRALERRATRASSAG